MYISHIYIGSMIDSIIDRAIHVTYILSYLKFDLINCN